VKLGLEEEVVANLTRVVVKFLTTKDVGELRKDGDSSKREEGSWFKLDFCSTDCYAAQRK
jgi:hypothetical protein